MLHWPPPTFEISNFIFHSHTTTSSARVAICTLQIALTFLWFFGMESKKKGFFAPPMAFQPSVHTVTWLECLGSCHAAQFMPLHAKNGCWVFGNAIRRSGTIVLHEVAFWYIDGRIFASREGISSQKKMSMLDLVRGTLWAGQSGHRGGWRETRVDYFPLWKFSPWKRTWDLTMKKKSTFNKSNMNRKCIQFYT